MPQQPVPAGVARSLARLKKFGRNHVPLMRDPKTGKMVVEPPQPVTVTLRDSLAPSMVVGPSVHATTVVDASGTVLAKLAPGELGTFHGDVSETTDTDKGKTTKVTWTRKDALTASAAPVTAAKAASPVAPPPGAAATGSKVAP
jgi:hypothetical protein